MTPSSGIIRLVRGDITEQAVDAIVNAANSSLLGGGGVDGAIHRAGGARILEECREIRAKQGRLPVGQAVATTAGRLPARRVIHTVGPIWNTAGDEDDEVNADADLQSAYRSSLELAAREGARSVAFPSISTGVYSFPIERAAEIALSTIAAFIEEHPEALDEVRMVLFSAEDYEVYQQAYDELVAEAASPPGV